MRPITAADLMNPEVLTVREDMPVEELARFLIENEISGAPVESADGDLVGVVSLHDVVAVAVEVESEEADETDDTGEPATAGDAAASPLDAGEPMAAEPGNPGSAGAGGDDDLDGLFWEDLLVEDIMTPKVVSVSEVATVPEIATLMLHEHLHRLLVLEDGEPRGIISTSDLLGLLLDEE